mgnify:CR=1 FL=1
MKLSIVPENEGARLAALQRYELVDPDDDPAMDRITEMVCTVLNVPLASLTVVGRQDMWSISCCGVDRTAMGRRDGLSASAILSDELTYLADARLDPIAAKHPSVAGPPHVRFFAAAPLVTPDGYRIGALVAADTRPRHLAESERMLLSSLAEVAMDKLELRRALREVEQLHEELRHVHEDLLERAAQDGLTGLWNRSAIFDLFEQTLHRAQRQSQPLSILMMDIDLFKRVNDTHGHPVGDQVLRVVVDRLGRCLRRNDMLGRIGGEEFLALLCPCTPEQATALAERCRIAVCSEPITVPTVDGDKDIDVSMSFGVAGFDGEPDSLDDLILRADALLYQSKAGGRNRVTSDVA